VKVADLQQHLSDLGRLLVSSGAKGVAKDLEVISAALKPFRDQPLKGFADFLAKAEAYSRGEGLHPAEKPRRATRSTAAKAPAADPAAVTAEVRDLYDRAASPSVTVEQIDGTCGKLTGLNKDGVVSVADQLGIRGMKSKAKAAIVEAIRQRILARKGATIRAGMVDRPLAVSGQGELADQAPTP
jgi:hypothetical protein